MQGTTGLDQIVVTRKVPSIHIFLSLEEIDTKTPGFQKGTGSTFWRDTESSDRRKNDDDYARKNRQNNRNNRSNTQQKRTRPNSDKPTNGTSTSTITS